MASIPYIDYNSLDDFYTINRLCSLFQMDRDTLKERCKQFDITPRRNDIGEIGLVRYDIRRLHNFIYYEGREKPLSSIDEAFAEDARRSK
ncbi:MAG: hypothetical protein IJO37_04775 [Ruminiclostridium sp.]|nr:hypothetical protein [Ruminiclostridium sp.]